MQVVRSLIDYGLPEYILVSVLFGRLIHYSWIFLFLFQVFSVVSPFLIYLASLD